MTNKKIPSEWPADAVCALASSNGGVVSRVSGGPVAGLCAQRGMGVLAILVIAGIVGCFVIAGICILPTYSD